SIRASLVLITVCLGVALWVGVGMLRVALGTPLTHLVVPGYLLVLLFLPLTEQAFVGIAADANGVATGPLANTFLLAVGFGAAAALSRDPMRSGLGLVGLIALAPLLSVMGLGILVRWRTRPKESRT